MTLKGRWADAAEEIAQACEHLVNPPQPQLGMALNQQAEVHRLRGEFDTLFDHDLVPTELLEGARPEPTGQGE